MKILLTTIALIFIQSIYSQIIYVGQSSNTWYVNAPSVGCNGIWAININQWPCGMACTYAAASPFGCLTTIYPDCDSIFGDTLYLKLCSLPCNIIASCDSSSPTCGTGTPLTTGINKLIAEELNIYPNPATNQIVIELIETKSTSIEIKNILGQTVKTIDNRVINKNQIEIDVSEFPNGLYFVQIQNGNKMEREKFVKE